MLFLIVIFLPLLFLKENKSQLLTDSIVGNSNLITDSINKGVGSLVNLNEHLISYSSIYETYISDFLFKYFLRLNTDFEGISYDTLDVYNYYNGIMYGTMYGVTYRYYLDNIKYAHKHFHDLNQEDVVLFMYKSNYSSFLRSTSPSIIYIYAFYCFRFTRYTFYKDYSYCCKEMGLDTSMDYLNKNNDYHEKLLKCIKRRFDQRYSYLIKRNSYYRIGFINRYYQYYNESKFIDKELMRPDV